MNNILGRFNNLRITSRSCRRFSLSATHNKDYSCKLLVVGGGSGGCTIAAKFAKRLKKDSVIVLEPSSKHYYQPLFTLVGAGVKPVSVTCRPEGSVLPSAATWVQDSAESIDADACRVRTARGDVINYEYIVVAVGLNNDYCQVPGLSEALEDEDSGVSTIYDPAYCEKTWRDLRRFRGGDAIFTYPNSPIKCPGAPQKIAYLADSYFTKANVRSNANIVYNTCLPVIFGVKKYADALLKVVEKKNIKVNYTTVLKEVRHEKKEAVFYSTVDPSKEFTTPYSLLHVTPPMRTPEFLRQSPNITDEAGYLTVDKYTLQHTKYPNMYGLGDCINTPNSKTAAAVAKQGYVLEQNLLRSMQSASPTERYNGYGACPLVTSYNTCIIAEFLYDGVPRETMPINQARESILAYYMKRDLFPFLYWNFMLKGNYNGPEFVRRIINPFAKHYYDLGPSTRSRKCKVLVLGAGAGGCSIAWRLSKTIRGKDIIVLEPSDVHYYQPMFSLVAAGINKFPQSHKGVWNVLPQDVVWLNDYADEIDPYKNVVHTRQFQKIHYDFMVVAVGLKNDYDKVPGLLNALDDPHSCVTTTYSSQYCEKTWRCLQSFKGGQALFTFPRQPGKCSGAALKIMFLADDYWRKQNLRQLANITFNTGAKALFGVQKYSTALTQIAAKKNMAVNCGLDLIELTPRGAKFITEDGQTITLPYNFLHVTPPMSPPTCLAKCEELVTGDGFLDVDKHTLQHKRFPNVYGIGDCTSTPNSKTAAAVARQSYVVERNLMKTMEGHVPIVKYEGYGACPVLTSYTTGILAESVYDKRPSETFPFDQSKERRLLGYLTKNYLPYLYWNKLIKGKWNGPLTLRKFVNPFER
ncbi:unnamed protein product, partial [Iphiclides podalirius]